MICENCGCEHDGSYATGRFCSMKCSKGFSTKAKRKEINKKLSESNKGQVAWNKGQVGVYHRTDEQRARISEGTKDHLRNYEENILHTDEAIKKVCGYCKIEFLTLRNRQFCSRDCRTKHSMQAIHEAGYYGHDKVNWSEVNKKSYAEGRNYVGGGTCKWFECDTSNGIVKVQGSYEVNAVKILDAWKKQSKIKDWEYTNDRVQYTSYDDTIHSYLLDFKVFNLDDSFYYVETKGRVKEEDEFKWKAVRDLGYELQVWHGDDIKAKLMEI